MKKIFQVGAGLVGKTMALDLSQDYELHLGDLNLDLLNSIKNHDNSIHVNQIDVQNQSELSSWIAEADIVLLAVPGFLGYQSLKTIINCGKDVVDISFSPENVLTLDQLAKEKNVTVVVDAGVAPGIPNYLLGYWNTKLEINSFDYCVGGLPKNPSPPYNYKAPFSPIDVIEEYTRPARMRINSQVVTKPALSDLEIFKFSEVGKLEAFNTDGLRSLLQTMGHIPNMKEKTLRYPGHATLMQSMIDKNLFDKIIYLNKKLSSRTTTGKLNRWLTTFIENNPPPLYKGKQNNIRYITQVNVKPPTFALFMSSPDDLPNSYKRFLLRSIVNTFDLRGVPIRIMFRKGNNPYVKK